MDRAHPLIQSVVSNISFFGNLSLRKTEHSNHKELQYLIPYTHTQYTWYTTPTISRPYTYWTILGRVSYFFPSETWTHQSTSIIIVFYLCKAH